MQEPPRHESELGFDQLSQFDRADQVCDAYERAWLDGQRPCLDDFLVHVPVGERDNLRPELELIQMDYGRRQAAKATPGNEETIAIDDANPSCAPDSHPPQIARYKIERLLGEGGFGRVYLARDEQLRRMVAVKVPHQRVLTRLWDAEAYLAEARIVANLDHPHIVPVYDVGSTADCPCYVVSKYIDGCDLATSIKQVRPSHDESAALLASVAEALHYAHTQGVVHRDVKPSNILLGSNGIPYVVDFGLALHEENIGMGPKYLGTPAYMSPEQAHGEGHQLDRRSDVFSLGVVFYELLAGRRPFQGDTQQELLEQVTVCEPPPMHQYDDEPPTELQRICHKALSRCPDDRYATAQELAADVRQFLATTCGEMQSLAPTALPQPKRRAIYHPSIVIPMAIIVLALFMSIWKVSMAFKREENRALRIAPLQSVAAGNNDSMTSVSNTHDGYVWPANTPPPAIAPFDGERAKGHQQAWADYLGVPVEYANRIGMKLRLIPPGEFTMGTTAAETETVLESDVYDTEFSRNVRSECPQHQVILPRPIYMGVCEVTQQQYETMMGSNPSDFAATGILQSKVANLDTRNFPVEKVSWNDASEFCAKLSETENAELRAGVGCRLPTEAEWEFACRAGTTSRFSFGDDHDELKLSGWWGPNSRGRTHAVGELNANPFGLYDMHGNVWEFVQDEWSPSLHSQFADKPAIDPKDESSAGFQCVVRGGRWVSSWVGCRSAARVRADSAIRSEYHTGFRIVMTVDAVRQAMQFEKLDSK